MGMSADPEEDVEVLGIAGNLFRPLRERHQELLKMASSAKKKKKKKAPPLSELIC